MSAYHQTTTYKKATYPTTHFGEAVVPLDLALLTRIVQIQGKSGKEQAMQKFISDYLIHELGLFPQGDAKGNIYCQKGQATAYPTMVAHMDTVHYYQESFSIHQSPNKQVLYAFNESTGDQAGIGGDDRCGIYVALHFLKHAPFGKVAFFVEEETGGQGSRASDLTFFDNSSVVLQCDRKGHDDWVQNVAGTQVASNEFINNISDLIFSHGYTVTQNGGFTDVGVLKDRGLKVCAANMSCGYYNPHQSSETIHLPALENTLNLCLEVLERVGTTPQLHTKPLPIAIPLREKTDYRQGNVFSSSINELSETRRRDPASSYFSPHATGWHYKGNFKGVNGYVKTDDGTFNGIVTVGPLAWDQCKAWELKDQQERQAIPLLDAKAVKEAKQKIKDWNTQDGTWLFNRSKKHWEKSMANEGDADDTRWIVAYAKKLENIPEQEAAYQKKWGGLKAELQLQPRSISLHVHTALERERVAAAEKLKAAQEREFMLQKTQLALPMNTDPATVLLASEEGSYFCGNCDTDVTATYTKEHRMYYCPTCEDWNDILDEDEDEDIAYWKRHWGADTRDMPVMD